MVTETVPIGDSFDVTESGTNVPVVFLGVDVGIARDVYGICDPKDYYFWIAMTGDLNAGVTCFDGLGI